jgi:hypothetical protein
VGDPDRRPELMREHMQDVVDVNRHARRAYHSHRVGVVDG